VADVVYEMKIVPLEDLTGMRGTLCHGAFDVLHVGHIRHLQAARRLGVGALIVTVTADHFMRKGPGRPIFPAEIRAECLAALACVHFVAIVEESTGLSAIETIRPLFYVKGREYDGQGGIAELERLAVEQHGGVMAYTDRWESTTHILERLHA